VELTAAGTGLYRHLDAVFTQVERIPEIVRTAVQEKIPVTVGLPQGLPHDWFLDVLEEAERELPGVAVSLHEATTDEQRQMLQQGLLDLALIHLQPTDGPRLLLLEQVMGIGVERSSPLAARAAIGFADLDGLTVMAHAVGEIAAEEMRLRAASAAAGVTINWVFRRFSEHSWLIARTARVDAVLLTEASASRHLPGWRWIPVRASGDARHIMDVIRTWAAWKEPAAPPLRALLDLLGARAVAPSRDTPRAER
jgi:DNA-binding transcriptional LysR family regulator